ncbi:MAG: ribonuclease H-like YkuK family protein [Bacillaceae bacterium]|nr:ribonuclease H-like YkuK family protein [Bacillaceae bacterium]
MGIFFQNLSRKHMTFQEVFQYICSFMEKEPASTYRLIIGTDSQVHGKYTRFVTGIVIRREGKGAWGCIRKFDIPTRIEGLHSKISIETTLTEQIAQLFTIQRKKQMINIILPHIKEGSSLTIEGHIDVGQGARNKTKVYVEEMVKRIEEHGMKPFIKPQSFVASSYANRYTK